MSYWLSEIENELRRGRLSQNPGRTRTAARRIAGIAIKELQSQLPHQLFGEDYLRALRTFANTEELPAAIVGAAQRLQARLSPDFTSPSVDPLGDAMIIVEFVKTRVSKK
jgi:hypothetical protein